MVRDSIEIPLITPIVGWLVSWTLNTSPYFHWKFISIHETVRQCTFVKCRLYYSLDLVRLFCARFTYCLHQVNRNETQSRKKRIIIMHDRMNTAEMNGEWNTECSERIKKNANHISDRITARILVHRRFSLISSIFPKLGAMKRKYNAANHLQILSVIVPYK